MFAINFLIQVCIEVKMFGRIILPKITWKEIHKNKKKT